MLTVVVSKAKRVCLEEEGDAVLAQDEAIEGGADKEQGGVLK